MIMTNEEFIRDRLRRNDKRGGGGGEGESETTTANRI